MSLKGSLWGIAVAAVLLTTPALAADDNKPFPPDTQIKFLKAQRQIQQLQLQVIDLQRKFDQATNTIKQPQGQMEADCTAAAKAANIDLTKYNCDLDQLMFVPKPEKK